MYPYSTIYTFFFFNDTATTEIYTLSLHDALPISAGPDTARRGHGDPRGQCLVARGGPRWRGAGALPDAPPGARVPPGRVASVSRAHGRAGRRAARVPVRRRRDARLVARDARAASRVADRDRARANPRSAHVLRAHCRRSGGLALARGAAAELAVRRGRRAAPRGVLATPRRGAVRYGGAGGQYRAAQPPGGRAVRARALSRLFVSPRGRCLRRAREIGRA